MKTILISIVFSLNLAVSFADTYTSKISDSECQSKGYDCALKNKCVKDFSIKPYARFHPLYKKAMRDVAVDPLRALNWPQIFNICPFEKL